MNGDPGVVLESLLMEHCDETRALQISALEMLCNDSLMASNIDHFFERYPPRTFLPVLCRIFLDEMATDEVFEIDARAITYYLDVSVEVTRRAVQVEGFLKAVCTRLEMCDMTEPKPCELAQQIVKMLQRISVRETAAVYEAGGLDTLFSFISLHGTNIFPDVLSSALDTLNRLTHKLEPSDVKKLPSWNNALMHLLQHFSNGTGGTDSRMTDEIQRCQATLLERASRRGLDISSVVDETFLQTLLNRLLLCAGISPDSDNDALQFSTAVSGKSLSNSTTGTGNNAELPPSMSTNPASANSSAFITSLLHNLCRASSLVLNLLLTRATLTNTLALVIRHGEESVSQDVFRLVDILLILLFESRPSTTPGSGNVPDSQTNISNQPDGGKTTGTTDSSATYLKRNQEEAHHKKLIDLIRGQKTDAFRLYMETYKIDPNYTDEVGQTLLNWVSAFGNVSMAEYLCEQCSADPNRGERSSSLHYAASFGRANIVRCLLEHHADPYLRDEEGKQALERAIEKSAAAASRRGTSGNNLFSTDNSEKAEDGKSSEKPSESVESDEKERNYDEVIRLLSIAMGHDIPMIDEDIEDERVMSEPSSAAALMGGNDDAALLQQKLSTQPQPRKAFVRELFPVMLGVYNESLNISVRKQTLSLLKKMVTYADKSLHQELCQIQLAEGPLPFCLAHLIYSVLTEEENDSTLCALEMCRQLIMKCGQAYRELLKRVGLPCRIQTLLSNTEYAEASQSVSLKLGTADKIPSREASNDEPAPTVTKKNAEESEPCVNPESSGSVPLNNIQTLREWEAYSYGEWNLACVYEKVYLFNRFAAVEVQKDLVTVLTGASDIPVELRPSQPSVEKQGLKASFVNNFLTFSGNLTIPANHNKPSCLFQEENPTTEGSSKKVIVGSTGFILELKLVTLNGQSNTHLSLRSQEENDSKYELHMTSSSVEGISFQRWEHDQCTFTTESLKDLLPFGLELCQWGTTSAPLPNSMATKAENLKNLTSGPSSQSHKINRYRAWNNNVTGGSNRESSPATVAETTANATRSYPTTSELVKAKIYHLCERLLNHSLNVSNDMSSTKTPSNTVTSSSQETFPDAANLTCLITPEVTIEEAKDSPLISAENKHRLTDLSSNTDANDILTQMENVAKNLYWSSTVGEYTEALKKVQILLEEDFSTTAYEWIRSGLVDALLYCLQSPGSDVLSSIASKTNIDQSHGLNELLSSSTNVISAGCTQLPLYLRQRLFCYYLRSKASNLAHKLVSALEQVEEYPVISRTTFLSNSANMGVFDPLVGSTVQATAPPTASAVHHLAFKMIIPVKLSTSKVYKKDTSGPFPLYDHQNLRLRIEALVTVGEVINALQPVVRRQWYEFERADIGYIRALLPSSEKESEKRPRVQLEFPPNCKDNDVPGLFHWIGYNGTIADLHATDLKWINPIEYGLISLCTSDGNPTLTSVGSYYDFITLHHLQKGSGSNNTSPVWSLTQRRAPQLANELGAWVAFDLGCFWKPQAYGFTAPKEESVGLLRNWRFQVSNDGQTWFTLKEHCNDSSFTELGQRHVFYFSTSSSTRSSSSAEGGHLLPRPPTSVSSKTSTRLRKSGRHAPNSVTISSSADQVSEKKVINLLHDAWRYVRIQITGPTHNNTFRLSFTALELYGEVTKSVPELGVWAQTLSDKQSRDRQHQRRFGLKHLCIGARVTRGPDWKWGDQDALLSGIKSEKPNDLIQGQVVSELCTGWVCVQWRPDDMNKSAVPAPSPSMVKVGETGCNYYRMGKEGRFDLCVVADSSGSALLPSLRRCHSHTNTKQQNTDEDTIRAQFGKDSATSRQRTASMRITTTSSTNIVPTVHISTEECLPLFNTETHTAVSSLSSLNKQPNSGDTTTSTVFPPIEKYSGDEDFNENRSANKQSSEPRDSLRSLNQEHNSGGLAAVLSEPDLQLLTDDGRLKALMELIAEDGGELSSSDVAGALSNKSLGPLEQWQSSPELNEHSVVAMQDTLSSVSQALRQLLTSSSPSTLQPASADGVQSHPPFDPVETVRHYTNERKWLSFPQRGGHLHGMVRLPFQSVNNTGMSLATSQRGFLRHNFSRTLLRPDSNRSNLAATKAQSSNRRSHIPFTTTSHDKEGSNTTIRHPIQLSSQRFLASLGSQWRPNSSVVSANSTKGNSTVLIHGVMQLNNRLTESSIPEASLGASGLSESTLRLLLRQNKQSQSTPSSRYTSWLPKSQCEALDDDDIHWLEEELWQQRYSENDSSGDQGDNSSENATMHRTESVEEVSEAQEMSQHEDASLTETEPLMESIVSVVVHASEDDLQSLQKLESAEEANLQKVPSSTCLSISPDMFTSEALTFTSITTKEENDESTKTEMCPEESAPSYEFSAHDFEEYTEEECQEELKDEDEQLHEEIADDGMLEMDELDDDEFDSWEKATESMLADLAYQELQNEFESNPLFERQEASLFTNCEMGDAESAARSHLMRNYAMLRRVGHAVARSNIEHLSLFRQQNAHFSTALRSAEAASTQSLRQRIIGSRTQGNALPEEIVLKNVIHGLAPLFDARPEARNEPAHKEISLEEMRKERSSKLLKDGESSKTQVGSNDILPLTLILSVDREHVCRIVKGNQVQQSKPSDDDQLKEVLESITEDKLHIEMEDPQLPVFVYMWKLLTRLLPIHLHKKLLPHVWEFRFSISYTLKEKVLNKAMVSIIEDHSKSDRIENCHQVDSRPMPWTVTEEIYDQRLVEVEGLAENDESISSVCECNPFLVGSQKAHSALKLMRLLTDLNMESIHAILAHLENSTESADLGLSLTAGSGSAASILSGASNHLTRSNKSLALSSTARLQALLGDHEKSELNSLNQTQQQILQIMQLTIEDFHSRKLSKKLIQQMRDPLFVTTGSLPPWAMKLVIRYPMLFPMEIRTQWLRACLLGPARGLVWLDSMRQRHQNNNSNASSNGVRYYTTRRNNDEFSVLMEQQACRLMKDILRLPRCATTPLHCESELYASSEEQKESFADVAWTALDFHAEKKAEMQVQFTNEAGTGIGPTLEFYHLLSEYFLSRQQQWGGCLWIHEDQSSNNDNNHQHQFINPSQGLFPAALPKYLITKSLLRDFEMLGIAVAKAIQDDRLMELPFSGPFLKLLSSGGELSETQRLSVSRSQRSNITTSSVCPLQEECSYPGDWLCRALTLHDFATLYPSRAATFYQLNNFVVTAERRGLLHKLKGRHSSHMEEMTEVTAFDLADEDEVNQVDHSQDEELLMELNALAAELSLPSLDDLCLDMTFYPTSKLQGYRQINLRDHYEWEEAMPGHLVEETQDDSNPEALTLLNIHHYLRRTLEFALDKGVRLQMEAFKRGFNRVFPMTHLRLFTHNELSQLICGEQVPNWSREDLQNYILISGGFSYDSVTIQLLFQVLLELSNDERRAFVQFTTGCCNLPPGGLKNLQPRLKIVRKMDGAYPSVNTCMHFLKLPEFSNKDQLRERLLAATKETGFYLN